MRMVDIYHIKNYLHVKSMTGKFPQIDSFWNSWIDESIFWHYHRLCNQLTVVTESITLVST